MEIKGRIKEIRKTVGLTQTKFAKRIAVATSYVSEVESGVKEINERAMRLIIAEFNVSEEWLRTGQGTMFKENLSASVSEVIGIFKSLDKHLQDCALKMLYALAETTDNARSKA